MRLELVERSVAAEDKERKRLYLEARVAAVEAQNEELDAQVRRLETLLQETLDVDDFFDLETMKVSPELPPFQPGSLVVAAPTPQLDSFMPPVLSGLGKFMPGAKAKHEEARAQAHAAHERASPSTKSASAPENRSSTKRRLPMRRRRPRSWRA